MRIEKEIRVLLENELWCVKSICMVPNAYAHADWREQRAERTQHPDAGSPLPRAGSSRSLLEPAAQPPARDVTARTNASCLCELIVGSSWWDLISFDLGDGTHPRVDRASNSKRVVAAVAILVQVCLLCKSWLAAIPPCGTGNTSARHVRATWCGLRTAHRLLHATRFSFEIPQHQSVPPA